MMLSCSTKKMMQPLFLNTYVSSLWCCCSQVDACFSATFHCLCRCLYHRLSWTFHCPFPLPFCCISPPFLDLSLPLSTAFHRLSTAVLLRFPLLFHCLYRCLCHRLSVWPFHCPFPGSQPPTPQTVWIIPPNRIRFTSGRALLGLLRHQRDDATPVFVYLRSSFWCC